MSEESVLRDLFDRWERVWHKAGAYEPRCNRGQSMSYRLAVTGMCPAAASDPKLLTRNRAANTRSWAGAAARG